MDDRLALFDAVVHLHDRVGDNRVAGRFTSDRESLKNGNAAGDERSQRAAEPRNRALACQIAEERHPQLEVIQNKGAFGRLRSQLEEERDPDDGPNNDEECCSWRRCWRR